MRYKRLGSAGFDVSEIGFGAWGIGGPVDGQPAYGPTDDQESTDALHRAFDLGVTFYDTSDLYGDGHSEKLIGEAFHNRRDKVIIATKVGFSGGGTQDFSPAHIRRSLEASLKRLGTDYVDLYQLHSPSMDLLTQDKSIMAELGSLKNEGKVRAIGLSARSPADALAAIPGFGFASVQVNFNLVDQRAATNGLFDRCIQHNVGIIARTPLAFGFLTGAYGPDSVYEQGDQRNGWSPQQRARWAEAPNLFWKAANDDPNQTASQLALRYCLSYPAVAAVIPGMLTTAHVEENLPASDMGGFSDDQITQFERIYQETEFFIGG